MEDSKIDTIDRLIVGYLEKEKMVNQERFPLQNCPSELQLCDYLEQRLTQEKEELLLKHVAECPNCLALLELAQEQREQIPDRPSAEMITRAQRIAQKGPKIKKRSRLLSYKWQILTLICFILSFIFTKYFLQFLSLAIIFGMKWVFDTGSTRTLIMIYQAWRKKDKGLSQRIIQDFQDKIEQRK